MRWRYLSLFFFLFFFFVLKALFEENVRWVKEKWEEANGKW